MIDFPPLTLPDTISSHRRWRPTHCAAICGERSVTWDELIARIHRVANALIANGLRKGEPVCLLMNNSIEMLELMLGTIKAGGVIAPLSPLMSGDSVEGMVRHAGARYLFAAADTLAMVEPARPRLTDRLAGAPVTVGPAPDGWVGYEDWLAGNGDVEPAIGIGFQDSISILYTSGTTGMPKGMEHSHFSRLLYPLVLGRLLKIEADCRVVLATPMCHNGTWVTMLPALYAGGTVIILEKFSAAGFLDAVARQAGSHAFLVPTQLNLLLAEPALAHADMSALQLIELAGSPLAPSSFQRARQMLPHVELCEIYGMAEGFMTYVGPDDYARGKAGTVGRPIVSLGTDIRLIGDDESEVGIGEIGEVVGRSALLLKGYHNDPERTRQSLWSDGAGREYLRSGDLARYDADGYLNLVGRKKDMIISGGINVYAVDIENVFMRRPDVIDVAAIGVPHEKWGETPLLLAIMRAGAATSEAELMAWGNERLGKTQRVSAVEFRPSFPRNTLDKILKRELRAPYWRGHERDI